MGLGKGSFVLLKLKLKPGKLRKLKRDGNLSHSHPYQSHSPHAPSGSSSLPTREVGEGKGQSYRLRGVVGRRSWSMLRRGSLRSWESGSLLGDGDFSCVGA